MANARLHIICGNCGNIATSGDMVFEIDPKGHDISGMEPKFKPAVFIKCKNCSTLHDLSDYIEEEINE